ncbi:site-specific integrase, partial [Tyzzerella sp. OttesenSCG-928-J15]|nr:site-specific integrase [Tyzzerella sp. OttesenSCG-928-J15]
APKRDTPEQSFWSADEALIALQAISDKKLHLAVHLAFACSLRVGEVLGLTWDCISMDDLTIRIDKVLQRIKTEAYEKTKKDEIYKVFRVKEDNSSSILVLKDPKTAKSRRSLYMTKPLRDELMLMRKDVERNKAYYGEMYEDHNLVFALEDGTPIESHLCTKWFRKWQRVNNEELGLPYIKFHGLRHSSTTYKLRLSNGNIKAVQADTGHSTAKMVTDTYGHSESKEQYKLTQAFEHNFYSGGNDTGADRADEFIQNMERLDMDSSSMESDQLKNYLKLLFKKNPQFQKEVLDEMFSLDGPDFESSILGSTHKNITAK